MSILQVEAGKIKLRKREMSTPYLDHLIRYLSQNL